ncbi:Clp protease N-terminal domain-containing protein [Streptomyces sp. NPDC047315]|uniref:Clp protease N-terminal domain-containing protein n=1 Tax=Streptomyces sp. NPDC047315 TaxID=3155142 RepID=UPI0033F973A5
MPRPTPRLPRQFAVPRTETDARLTPELASAVAGARRRALRDGGRQIDTAHLLHSLVETDPTVRAALGPGPRVARVLGYLVQRSIGYGLRWQGSVEDSGAVPVVRVPGPRAAGGAGAWSPSAVDALEGAVRRAALRGAARATGVDVLAGLTADPGCRAMEVLRRAGVDAAELAEHVAPGERVDRGRGGSEPGGGARPPGG